MVSVVPRACVPASSKGVQGQAPSPEVEVDDDGVNEKDIGRKLEGSMRFDEPRFARKVPRADTAAITAM